jgi:hypothetical protein
MKEGIMVHATTFDTTLLCGNRIVAGDVGWGSSTVELSFRDCPTFMRAAPERAKGGEAARWFRSFWRGPTNFETVCFDRNEALLVFAGQRKSAHL